MKETRIEDPYAEFLNAIGKVTQSQTDAILDIAARLKALEDATGDRIAKLERRIRTLEERHEGC